MFRTTQQSWFLYGCRSVPGRLLVGYITLHLKEHHRGTEISIFLLTGQGCTARFHRDLNPLFSVVYKYKITYTGGGISDLFGMLILMLQNPLASWGP